MLDPDLRSLVRGSGVIGVVDGADVDLAHPARRLVVDGGDLGPFCMYFIIQGPPLSHWTLERLIVVLLV